MENTFSISMRASERPIFCTKLRMQCPSVLWETGQPLEGPFWMPHPAIRPSLLGSSELLRIKQKDFKALCKVALSAFQGQHLLPVGVAGRGEGAVLTVLKAYFQDADVVPQHDIDEKRTQSRRKESRKWQRLSPPKLNQEEINNWNRLITRAEIESVIIIRKNLPINKSPEPDGFTGEFYQIYKELI
ncbi:uncharacterized protein AAG666_013756 isoform 2-T4 [Megaptera novaeangliae]